MNRYHLYFCQAQLQLKTSATKVVVDVWMYSHFGGSDSTRNGDCSEDGDCLKDGVLQGMVFNPKVFERPRDGHHGNHPSDCD